MDRLSPELLHIVVSFLDIADRLSFRLVNKNFSFIGAAHIIPEVCFHLHGKDFAKLRAIAANPVIARNVKSLTYFSARYESPGVSFTRYRRHHRTSMEVCHIDEELMELRGWKMDLTTAQLMAHYKRYLESIVSQNAIVANKLDLVCLKEVMPSFTNLRRVTMSSGHQFYERRKRPKSPFDEYVREPYHDAFPEGVKQLETLLETLVLHEVSIEQLRAGIMSWRFFDMQPDRLARLFSPLTNLKYIDLHLTIETDDNGRDVTNDTNQCRSILGRGAVRDLLQSLPALETLVFCVQSDFERLRPAASLDWIIAPGYRWLNLTQVEFDGLDCTKETLTDFLDLHKSTLTDLCLSDISLTNGSWKSVLPFIRANLDLEEVCICGRLCGYSNETLGTHHDPDDPTEIYDLWTIESGPSDMRASVNCYCANGGVEYPDELPLDQKVIRKYFESHVRRPGMKSEAEDELEMIRAEREVGAQIRSLDLFGMGNRAFDSDGFSSDSEYDADLEPWHHHIGLFLDEEASEEGTRTSEESEEESGDDEDDEDDDEVEL